MKAGKQLFHAFVAFRELLGGTVSEGQNGLDGLWLVRESRRHKDHRRYSGFDASTPKLARVGYLFVQIECLINRGCFEVKTVGEFLYELMASLDGLVCTGQCRALGPHLQLFLPLHYRAQPEVAQVRI